MVIVLGSTNLDQIGTVTRLPAPGETVAGTGFAVAPGGKGANQALAARRAGSRVRHVSAVGDDSFAETALHLLAQDGVDLSGVTRVTDHTGIAMILVDAKGENMIAVLPGANAHVGPEAVQTALAGRGRGDMLLLQQEIPHATNRLALAKAREQGVTTMLNIAPFVPETGEIAGLADILVANETEFALLAGADAEPLEEAMLRLAAARNQVIVVTLGADGVRIAQNGRMVTIPAWPVEVIDSVGAGDTFCGYLAAGLEAGDDIETVARRAARAGSLACTKPGAQPAIPFATEVAALR